MNIILYFFAPDPGDAFLLLLVACAARVLYPLSGAVGSRAKNYILRVGRRRPRK